MQFVFMEILIKLDSSVNISRKADFSLKITRKMDFSAKIIGWIVSKNEIWIKDIWSEWKIFSALLLTVFTGLYSKFCAVFAKIIKRI